MSDQPRAVFQIGQYVLHPDDPAPGIVRGFSDGYVLVDFMVRGEYGCAPLDEVDPSELRAVSP